mgnify:CR=1 FL=1
MRSREEILAETEKHDYANRHVIEVLLDIRDLMEVIKCHLKIGKKTTE